MLQIAKNRLPLYLIEGWALGMFMLSATLFTGWLEIPGQPLHEAVSDPFLRRWLSGCAMGLTAIALIYSGWGRRSGAHMNPALTLTFSFLGKISRRDAVFYVFAQCAGGALAMILVHQFLPALVEAPQVNFVQTQPGAQGGVVAFLLEMLISFLMVLMVLYSSNYAPTSRFTGVFAGVLVMLFITFESPYSGMSMNPARTLASAAAAGNYTYLWLYFTAPPIGMLAAAITWKTWICKKDHFHCSYQSAKNTEEKTTMLPG